MSPKVENTHANIIQVIHDYMSDAETAWHIGEHATFSRDKDDEKFKISLDHAGGLIVSDTGAVRIAVTAMSRLVPAEGLTEELWVQAGLLCLRDGDAGMAKRSVLTELGNDVMATQPLGRLAILFDLGLSVPHVDICIRTANEKLCRLLREREGTAIASTDTELSNAIKNIGADFVTLTRMGRIESFGQRSVPEKPHELLPPNGYAVCMSFEPPRPQKKAPFDEATFGAFQALYSIFADPELVRLKQSVNDALRDATDPKTMAIHAPEARTAVAVLLRQLTARDGLSDYLRRWRDAFDC